MSSTPGSPHFLGLRTVIYHAPALAEVRDWYAEALGIAPYFDQPFYVGFNVGGFELGLDPDASEHSGGGSGAVAYWGVIDIAAARQRLLALGATERTGPQEVGEGIKVATVTDPFGNVLGMIENPHFSLPSA